MAAIAVEGSRMETLPVDTLTHVLKYVSIVDRLQLARGNKTMRERVYRECSNTWEDIDFYTDCISNTVRKRLTDHDLSELLIRVNAKEVTKSLCLVDCKALRGNGLVPLRNSKTFESINLEGTGAEDNPTTALSILRSMTPFSLFSVTFSSRIMKNPSESVADFYRCLRSAKLEEACDNHTICDSCSLPVADRSRAIVPGRLGGALLRCEYCGKNFCRRGSCPIALKECSACLDYGCSSCSSVLQCCVCGHSYCKYCTNVYECDDCDDKYCKDCDAIDGPQTIECDYCEKATLCKSCIYTPSSCVYDCSLCKECNDLGSCSHCEKSFCFGCEQEKARRCTACSKRYCSEDSCTAKTKHCAACDNTFCVECKDMEHCNVCDEDFCLNHNRLIDCESCRARHCRPCGYDDKRGCNLCGARCYEGCACNTNIGDRPTKKAKLS